MDTKSLKKQLDNVTPKQAIEIQNQLAGLVSVRSFDKKIRTIAGADVSLNMFGKDLYAGIIVLSYPDLNVIDHACVKIQVSFPYIPGLLSFREIPGLLKCFDKLNVKPDIIVVDGQGITHPRRMGIASHFGVLIDTPTIGCGKSRLYGDFKNPTEFGDAERIIDPKTRDQIGWAFQSKRRANPIIISPGHLVSIDQSLEIIKTCIRGYRLPEPTRLAHELVNAFRLGQIT